MTSAIISDWVVRSNVERRIMKKENLTEENGFRIQKQHPRIGFIEFNGEQNILSTVTYTGLHVVSLS